MQNYTTRHAGIGLNGLAAFVMPPTCVSDAYGIVLMRCLMHPRVQTDTHAAVTL